MVFSCKQKKTDNTQLVYGRWKIFTSEDDERRMQTGKQKIFFLFNRDGSGLFYYYNVDYSTGNQYARKNKHFRFKVTQDFLEMNWLDDNSTDRWPFSFREENKLLVLSDPTPGGQTFVLERSANDE
jgi:hypothetical protein